MSDQDLKALVEQTLSQAGERVSISVWAKPGARRSAITGTRERNLCVAVTAPADRGRANQAIAELLSDAVAAPRTSVELASGPTSRRKRFVVSGVAASDVVERISKTLGDSR